MLPSYAMEPQDELQHLLARQDALKQELKAKEERAAGGAAPPARHSHQSDPPRPSVRLSATDRKRRTRRLILIGSYIEHRTQADPAEHDRLLQGLNGFLERDQDRALVRSARDHGARRSRDRSTPRLATAPPAHRRLGRHLPGRHGHAAGGAGGRTHHRASPKQGPPWTATVTAVLNRSRDQVLVTDSGRPVSP